MRNDEYSNLKGLRIQVHPLSAAERTPKEPSGAGSGESDALAPAVRLVLIDENSAGQRLDNFLIRSCKGVPRSHLYQLIRSGQLRVDGHRARADHRLEAGEQVRIPPVRVALPQEPRAGTASPAAARAGELLPVIFEDEGIIAIDKPAGVAVHGGSGIASGAIEQLRAARPDERFLELVHRLDRDTSGVLLFARKRPWLLDLHRQLRERSTDKRYLAIVAGRFPKRTKTFSFGLQRYLTTQGERRVAVDPQGQEARTRITGLGSIVLPSLGEFSLVEAELLTGRTHQIRVHLAQAGFPIAGDDKYGNFELNRSLARAGHRRMFLHAARIAFRHPRTGRVMTVRAPVPSAFAALVPAAGTIDG